MNKVTIQFMKFHELDRFGNEVGEATYGYCIFDDHEEVVSPYYGDQKMLKEFMSKPAQAILDFILEHYKDKFADSILGNGFYINTDWFFIDSLGNVENY